MSAVREPAQKELVIGMQEIVGGSFGYAVQKAFEGPEGAALTRFVGAEDDRQSRTFRVESQGLIREWAKGDEVEPLDPHLRLLFRLSRAARSALTSFKSSPIPSERFGNKGSSPPKRSGGNLLLRSLMSGI